MIIGLNVISYRQLLTKVPKVAGACVQKISLVVDTNQKSGEQRDPSPKKYSRRVYRRHQPEELRSRMTEGQMYRICRLVQI